MYVCVYISSIHSVSSSRWYFCTSQLWALTGGQTCFFIPVHIFRLLTCLATCCKHNFRSHLLIAQKANSLSTSRCICQAAQQKANPSAEWQEHGGPRGTKAVEPLRAGHLCSACMLAGPLTAGISTSLTVLLVSHPQSFSMFLFRRVHLVWWRDRLWRFTRQYCFFIYLFIFSQSCLGIYCNTKISYRSEINYLCTHFVHIYNFFFFSLFPYWARKKNINPTQICETRHRIRSKMSEQVNRW